MREQFSILPRWKKRFIHRTAIFKKPETRSFLSLRINAHSQARPRPAESVTPAVFVLTSPPGILMHAQIWEPGL